MSIYVQKLDFIKILLPKYKEKALTLDKKGASVLHWAAKSENLAIFTYLIGFQGLESLINHKDFKGNTVLHYIAEDCDMIEIYEEFLKRGGELRVKNIDGLTAEDIAKEKENIIGKEILENLNKKDEKNNIEW